MAMTSAAAATSPSMNTHHALAVAGSISPLHAGGGRELVAATAAVTTKTAKGKRKVAKPRKRSPKFVWRQRDAQDSRYYNLQLDINDIKQQIQELSNSYDMLLARSLTSKALRPGVCLRTVHEYLRVVRHGLNPAPAEVDVVAFLTNIMAPDVWINDFLGSVELILSQWAIYASCFEAMDIRCVQAIALPIEDTRGRQGFVVRAQGVYSASVTANTLHIMFPHVLQYAPQLANKLIERTIHGHTHYDFVFDCHSGRILRCDVTVDFFGAFATVLPDPRELSFLFSGAKVESDFYLGEGDDRPAEGPVTDSKPFKELPPSHSSVETPSSTTATREAEPPTNKMDLHHILS